MITPAPEPFQLTSKAGHKQHTALPARVLCAGRKHPAMRQAITAYTASAPVCAADVAFATTLLLECPDLVGVPGFEPPLPLLVGVPAAAFTHEQHHTAQQIAHLLSDGEWDM